MDIAFYNPLLDPAGDLNSLIRPPIPHLVWMLTSSLDVLVGDVAEVGGIDIDVVHGE